MNTRKLVQVLDARPSSDGDGVKIRRIAGQQAMRIMNPFLLLDEIRSEEGADYVGGFPSHPHRGFETITYMLEGAMRHRDHMGNEGVIASGDVQWMTAGRGVIHSEMPEQEDGLLHGFQLWLNLPAARKMEPAAYQEISREQIPLIPLDGGSLRLIAGNFGGSTGPVDSGSTEASYMDLSLQANASVEIPVNSEHNAIVLVFEGATRELGAGQMGVYRGGDSIVLATAGQAARMLVLAGAPIDEPIAHYGPFVMNTSEEIEQAIRDYNEGRLVA
ncbi:pirin family protein [Seongchinamella sediminis]|uniref:Pirin family protein n=1 Tax=Seongchinamella sediminis TaxID=2283635 RepID=A0A3L7E285_9GAMM|nr:pirin family protein [Seongchinamella sediminis]RLQ23614.1 pirin family protein [Seongchinamella sediminis]